MILSDFLSQQDNDDSNPNKIIPISFDMYKIMENIFLVYCVLEPAVGYLTTLHFNSHRKLTQPPARMSQERVLNPGPVA